MFKPAVAEGRSLNLSAEGVFHEKRRLFHIRDGLSNYRGYRPIHDPPIVTSPVQPTTVNIMTILITGATGRVGSKVVEQLLERGADVRVLVRDPSKTRFAPEVEVVQGDMLDLESLRRAFAGVSTFFLLNAVAADEFTQALIALNIAREAGVNRVVYLSVIHADRFVNVPHFAVKSSFLRRDGTVWTTDKDGLIPALLAAEIRARKGRDPSEMYKALTDELGEPVSTRVEAKANFEQKALLSKLSPDQVTSTELAGEKIEQILSKAPGNDQAIGGLKVITENGWFAARPSGTEDIYKIYAESFKGEDHLKRLVAEAQVLVDGAIAP